MTYMDTYEQLCQDSPDLWGKKLVHHLSPFKYVQLLRLPFIVHMPFSSVNMSFWFGRLSRSKINVAVSWMTCGMLLLIGLFLSFLQFIITETTEGFSRLSNLTILHSLLPLNTIISSCLYFLGEQDTPACYQKDILIQNVSCFHTCLKLESFRFWNEYEYEYEI